MRILAIETSCDETAISVLSADKKEFKILSNVISSQVKIHAEWGGVVPSLAKREHLKNLPVVLKKALARAKIKKPEKKINLIAVTQGPGLEPALWTGINFAEELAKKWSKPLIPINHMEGHFFSVFLKNRKEGEQEIPKLEFPVLALLVSGGHTELILVKDWLKYKILGQTRDDAAGEAFDKVAKMMNLGYPGGPIISRLANVRSSTSNIELPRPMINSKDYDFSFSGLKTAVLYTLKKFPVANYKLLAPGICREFQQAVIDVLISKTIRAAKEYKAKTIIVAGGVAANKELRKQFGRKIKKELPITNYLLPITKFSGDNAAMIALAAYFRFKANKKSHQSRLMGLKALGNLKISY
ncbi:tRNA (adenosine(37)-N6)-threonylcarbamoyltransferase complex transferase subunit TsaD [Patescibacteria group bacterium]|nr:tRNA (adenosine(37)-N6)-threonylcarbamoyltransferase complex transferase subunit TsaD [Patescibacteria group bacterium]